MGKPKHVLSLAADGQGQLSIHGDAQGLAFLIDRLTAIREQVVRGSCTHDHLMTDSWGGDELTEKAPTSDGALIHHVKAYGWTSEWVEKHGLGGGNGTPNR